MKVPHLILAMATALLLGGGCSHVATVTQVYDGDTIKVGRKKVRLVGVDTPEQEWKEKGVKEQCFAKEATAYLKELVDGKKVRLESDPIGKKQDKYGRYLAYVYVGDKLVNAEIIKGGYGYAYTYFPFSKSDEFKKYHEEVKSVGRGMWSACNVECKWKFCEIGWK